MRIGKWMGNIAILFMALVVCFLLSGSYHETCVTPTIETDENAISGALTLSVADEGTDVFKAISDATNNITVYVAHGNTVDIPVTFTVDFDDEPALEGTYYMKINGTVYPCSAAEGNVFTASMTQSYTASEGAADLDLEVTGYYMEETSESFSYTLPVKSVPLVVCPGCDSVIAYDGTMTHTPCTGCGAECIDGVVEHATCPSCGETCVDGVVEHAICSSCGEGCVDGVFEHGVCPGCGEACADGVVEHGTCPGCGEACADGVVEHATCSSCGEGCVNGVFEHGTCPGCGEECADGTVTHAVCETCDEACTGNGIVHKEDCNHTDQTPGDQNPTVPNVPGTPNDPGTPNNPGASVELPLTGDSTPVAVYLLAMLMSLGAIVAILVHLKREKA